MHWLHCVHSHIVVCNGDVCCGRMYAIRRIKDGFRMHRTESDRATIEQLIKQAERSHEVIQRQVTIYSIGHLSVKSYP